MMDSLVFGTKQRTDFQTYAFVMRTDLAGNKLWEKYFGAIERNVFLGSVLKINENEFVIGASTLSLFGTPWQESENTSTIFRH